MKPDNRQTQFTKKRYNTTSAIYNLMEWPVEQLWYKKWRTMLWRQVGGPEVLEIGVGTGKNIPYYRQDLQVTGIDLSPGMLAYARKKLGHLKDVDVEAALREMDVQEMGFRDHTFNDVVATFVFCSVPDPVLGLKEALRVTRPGGRIFLLEHMIPDYTLPAAIMKKLDAPFHYISGVHIARNTLNNIEKAGWKVEETRDLTRGGIFKYIQASKPNR